MLSTPLFFKLHWFLEILNELPDKMMLLISKCVCFHLHLNLSYLECQLLARRIEMTVLWWAQKADVLTLPLSHCGNKPHTNLGFFLIKTHQLAWFEHCFLLGWKKGGSQILNH